MHAMKTIRRVGTLLVAGFCAGCGFISDILNPVLPGSAWAGYTIDAGLAGADGVRTADVDNDGWPDLAVPWEEGGRVRVYLHPGPGLVRIGWPSADVGIVAGPEDAVFADLDGDGAQDVISSSEDARRVSIHWAPGPATYLVSLAWTTMTISATENQMQWMFAAPADIDGQHGPDLFVGGKESGGQVGWLQAPVNPRDPAGWIYHPLQGAGWIMSLIPADLDGDGDSDVIVTDRRGANRGCYWLENPGPAIASNTIWPRRLIGGNSVEVMFATLADLDGDSTADLIAATAERQLLYFRRTAADARTWTTATIPLPDTAGTGKAVAVGDIDLDGQNDLVVSCENATGDRLGAFWMSYVQDPGLGVWITRDIAGTAGSKFDLIELLDLDTDGDLDVLTTEETGGLGAVWYQNPTR